MAKLPTCTRHWFSTPDINSIRCALLEWYSGNKRMLPWRDMASHDDNNVKAYAVWVSEVMLQQTKVSSVIDYYNKWMLKWPTVVDLAQADLEEVLEVWSGLGYYSRGKRLHEGAQKIMKEMDGVVPQTSATLRQLPGIGQYTSCAIASICFKEVKGVVDGNVIRVLTRMRIVGTDVDKRDANEWLWKTADGLVDVEEPGDFNQALMELGATVCTPKSPSCRDCPIRSYCLAYRQVNGETEIKGSRRRAKVDDIENIGDCKFCLPSELYDSELGVQNYPRKSKKKGPRNEVVAVGILYRESCKYNKNIEYLVIRRPDNGLLANLWEFPNVTIDANESEDQRIKLMRRAFQDQFCLRNELLIEKFEGQVLHIFSHIRCTYLVYSVNVIEVITIDDDIKSVKWVTEAEWQKLAVSTAMRKVFKMMTSAKSASSKTNVKGKRKSKESPRSKTKVRRSQSTLSSFLKMEK